MSQDEVRETRAAELVPQQTNTGEVVPQQKMNKAVAVEVDGEVCDLGTAVAKLSSVIQGIGAQDISFEYTEDRSSARSTRHLKLRAYRRVG
jgi:hypothetical protein